MCGALLVASLSLFVLFLCVLAVLFRIACARDCVRGSCVEVLFVSLLSFFVFSLAMRVLQIVYGAILGRVLFVWLLSVVALCGCFLCLLLVLR